MGLQNASCSNGLCNWQIHSCCLCKHPGRTNTLTTLVGADSSSLVPAQTLQIHLVTSVGVSESRHLFLQLFQGSLVTPSCGQLSSSLGIILSHRVLTSPPAWIHTTSSSTAHTLAPGNLLHPEIPHSQAPQTSLCALSRTPSQVPELSSIERGPEIDSYKFPRQLRPIIARQGSQVFRPTPTQPHSPP